MPRVDIRCEYAQVAAVEKALKEAAGCTGVGVSFKDSRAVVFSDVPEDKLQAVGEAFGMININKPTPPMDISEPR